jgi:hypothetical protein
MPIKKDETYFRQYVNKLFSLPSRTDKYAIVDVKKIGKIYYFVYIGFENHSSDEPAMEECKTLLKTVNILDLPCDYKCESCQEACAIVKNSEQNNLSCPKCFHASNCQSCDECGVDVYWEHAKKKDDMRVCEDCFE